MHFCCQRTLSLLLSGLVLGVLTFLLILTRAVTLLPYTVAAAVFLGAAAAVAALGLLTLALGVLIAPRTAALTEAWHCCGALSALAAAAVIPTALLVSVTVSFWPFAAGVALCVALLTLHLGGLLCFLRQYLTTRFCTC